jgi:threonine/homoserine/homoserine lactone efflux protein
MPVNTIVVLAADKLSSWLRNNKKVLRGLDYSFAGVFSIFAVKIFMTQSR